MLTLKYKDATLYNVERPVKGTDTRTDSDHTLIKRGDSGQKAGWSVLTDRRRRFGGFRRLQPWRGAKPRCRVWPASAVHQK